MVKINATDPVVVTLMLEWEKLENKRYLDWYSVNGYKATACTGTVWMRLDIGGSGAFMLNREDGLIYCIKRYGTVDKKKCVGRLGVVTGEKLFKNRFWNLKNQKEAL